MRVITNEQRIKIGRRNGTILFFLSLGVLTGGLFVTNLLPVNTLTLTIVPCIVMPLGIITTALSVRYTNEYVRVPRPEKVLYEGLQGINRRSILFNYFPQAKHILVTPHGIFVLTTRFQVTKVTVTGDKWVDAKARGPLAPFFQYLKQERMGNPFDDATLEAAKVQAVVDAALPDSDLEVEPVVLFTNEKAILELNGPTFPVAFASPRKKPTVKSVLRDNRKDKQQEEYTPLSDEEISALYDAFIDSLNQTEKNNLIIEEEE